MGAISALLLISSLRAWADVSFGKWEWDIVTLRHGRHLPPLKISKLFFSGEDSLAGRLEANISLKNSGADREGILLRYDLSAKVYSISNPRKEKGWTIPFAVDERRIPRLKSGQGLNVSFDITEVTRDYFKRLSLEGWRPEKIKMKIMIEPQQGEDSALKKTESILPIVNLSKSTEKKGIHD